MRRHIKAGELLAIKPDRIHHDANGAWWDDGVPVPPNEVRGSIHIVYIRGELEHHDGPNSYDCIRAKMSEAFACPDTTSVLVCMDSPGGVVAGLNSTVRAIRKMADESGKPLIGYVNEMCASAAYAVATSFDELYCPDSAIIGAIGVIATMGDQVGADKRMGLNFVTLTSGARKADGHPHVKISDGAIAAEQARVDRSARTFWAMVGQSRGLSPATVQGYEAGIFVGKFAVKAGLCDDVMDFDELLALLSEEKNVAQPAQRVSTSQPPGTPAKTEPSMLALRALLKRTMAALAKATDPTKKASLSASVVATKAALEAYKKVKKTVKYEAESDEGDMDDDEAEEAEESEEAEEEEKGNETDRKEDIHVHDDGDDDGDSDDGDDSEEEEDEEEEKVAAKAKSAKKAKAAAARGAMAGLTARLDRIERDTLKRNQSALISEALASRRITRAQAKHLATESHAFVASFLKMAKKPLVAVDEDSLQVPDGTPHGDVGRAALAQIDLAVSTMNLPSAEAATKVRDEMIAEHRRTFAKANGAPGRY